MVASTPTGRRRTSTVRVASRRPIAWRNRCRAWWRWQRPPGHRLSRRHAVRQGEAPGSRATKSTTSHVEVQGSVAPGFEASCEAFKENSGDTILAAPCCVQHRGDKVVGLLGRRAQPGDPGAVGRLDCRTSAWCWPGANLKRGASGLACAGGLARQQSFKEPDGQRRLPGEAANPQSWPVAGAPDRPVQAPESATRSGCEATSKTLPS